MGDALPGWREPWTTTTRMPGVFMQAQCGHGTPLNNKISDYRLYFYIYILAQVINCLLSLWLFHGHRFHMLRTLQYCGLPVLFCLDLCFIRLCC